MHVVRLLKPLPERVKHPQDELLSSYDNPVDATHFSSSSKAGRYCNSYEVYMNDTFHSRMKRFFCFIQKGNLKAEDYTGNKIKSLQAIQ